MESVLLRLAIVGVIISTTALAQEPTANMLDRAADKYGVPRSFVRAVAEVESGTRCGAKNGGSRGIMQVQKGAAKEVGVQWPFKDCESEIEAGVKYLKLALNKGGYNCQGATLYNEGLNARRHCSEYGRKVMKIKNKLST